MYHKPNSPWRPQYGPVISEVVIFNGQLSKRIMVTSLSDGTKRGTVETSMYHKPNSPWRPRMDQSSAKGTVETSMYHKPNSPWRPQYGPVISEVVIFNGQLSKRIMVTSLSWMGQKEAQSKRRCTINLTHLGDPSMDQSSAK
ncbi:hypothetical protein ACOME3_000481 [Neoechinorhynchus agilis]